MITIFLTVTSVKKLVQEQCFKHFRILKNMVTWMLQFVTPPKSPPFLQIDHIQTFYLFIFKKEQSYIGLLRQKQRRICGERSPSSLIHHLRFPCPLVLHMHTTENGVILFGISNWFPGTQFSPQSFFKHQFSS